MTSMAAQPQYALWQTNSAVSTHDSWYTASDEEGDEGGANAEKVPPPAASPNGRGGLKPLPTWSAASRSPPPRTTSTSDQPSIFDGQLRTLSIASSCASRTGSDSARGGPHPTLSAALSDVSNASCVSENVDVLTPQVDLSFGPASTRGRQAQRRGGAAAKPAIAAAADGPGSPTVGDWTATLEYCLEDTKRSEAFGLCLQAGVVVLVRQVTTDDEGHVPKPALDALQNEIRSPEAYDLEAAAAQLAAAIGSDSIPVKLKALNVLVTIVPTACFCFGQSALACCTGPCEDATWCSIPHPTRLDAPAAMVRQSALRALEMLARVQAGEICKPTADGAPDLNSLSVGSGNRHGSAKPVAGTHTDGGGLRGWLTKLVLPR